MAAATEVPLDWQPGTRDGRLMMLLLDELRQEPVLPLHLPQPAEPGWRASAAPSCGIRSGRTAWPTGPLVGVDPKTVQRLFLRHTGMTFGRAGASGAAAGGDGTAGARRAGAGRGAGPGLRVRAPSRPCSARPWRAAQRLRGARGGVRLRVAGPARASGRKPARTWPEVGAESGAWGSSGHVPRRAGAGTGVLLAFRPSANRLRKIMPHYRSRTSTHGATWPAPAPCGAPPA